MGLSPGLERERVDRAFLGLGQPVVGSGVGLGQHLVGPVVGMGQHVEPRVDLAGPAVGYRSRALAFVEQPPVTVQPESGAWYYCVDPPGYFPYVAPATGRGSP